MTELTRRVGETFQIGDDISVTVLGINDGQVRLTLDLPLNIVVFQKEAHARVRLEAKEDAE